MMTVIKIFDKINAYRGMILKKFFLILIFLILPVIYNDKVDAYEEFGGNYQYSQYNENGQYEIQQRNPDDEVLFIVDFSGSMNHKMGYSPKAYLAIDALNAIVRETQGSAKIGLRIFGVTDKPTMRQTSQGLMFNKENICTASNLILPIARYNGNNIADSLSRINPQGGTPIGYALRQAVQNDFSYGPHLKHIILITDGDENCGDDPCMFIRNLMRTRNDFRIDVIGITVDNNAYSRLGCIANAGHGNYYSVTSPEDFKIKFKQAFDNVKHFSSTVQTPQISATVQNRNVIQSPMLFTPSNIKYKMYGFQFEY